MTKAAKALKSCPFCSKPVTGVCLGAGANCRKVAAATAAWNIRPTSEDGMKHYYGACPGRSYAGSFYGKNVKEARDAMRKFLGVKRLPNGTRLWRD